jgi:hypothetical protein
MKLPLFLPKDLDFANTAVQPIVFCLPTPWEPPSYISVTQFLNFRDFEGSNPNPPRFSFEVWDFDPGIDMSLALREVHYDILLIMDELTTNRELISCLCP